MRIAVVGAGVSGLVVAHLLHHRHEVTVFEAAGYAGGHTNTIRVDTPNETHDVDTGFIVFNDRNYPSFERLLTKLEVAVAAVDDELQRQRRDGRLRVLERIAERLVREPPASADAVVSPDGGRPRALQPRRARVAVAGLVASGPSLGDWLERQRFSRAFVERLIVPQASAVWSADPRQMWTFPARFLAEFFDHHGMLGFRDRPRWRTIQRRLEALRRGADRPVHGSPAPVDAGGLGRPLRRPRARPPARGRGRAVRRGRARDPFGPGARRCSRTRPTASGSFSARSRISATRRCSTPTRGCCRDAGGRGRAGTTTCSPSRRVPRPSPTT